MTSLESFVVNVATVIVAVLIVLAIAVWSVSDCVVGICRSLLQLRIKRLGYRPNRYRSDGHRFHAERNKRER